MEKGAITLNDKLSVCDQADGEFGQVLLFVVCVCVCLSSEFVYTKYFLPHMLYVPTLDSLFLYKFRFYSLAFSASVSTAEE